MGAWLSRRFRRWIVFAVGVPVLGWTLGRAGEELERRRGRSRSSDLLRSGGEMLDRRRRPRGGREDDDR